mgnify:FL=1
MKDDILRILWRVPADLTLSRHLLRAQLAADSGTVPGDGELNAALAEMLRDGWLVSTRNRRTGDEELALTALGREVFES